MFTKPLTTIELTLKLQGQTKLTQSAGSLFHGVIMELIGPAYAAKMHEEALRPYSQYIYVDKKASGILPVIGQIARNNQKRQKKSLRLCGNCRIRFA